MVDNKGDSISIGLPLALELTRIYKDFDLFLPTLRFIRTAELSVIASLR